MTVSLKKFFVAIHNAILLNSTLVGLLILVCYYVFYQPHYFSTVIGIMGGVAMAVVSLINNRKALLTYPWTVVALSIFNGCVVREILDMFLLYKLMEFAKLEQRWSQLAVNLVMALFFRAMAIHARKNIA